MSVQSRKIRWGVLGYARIARDEVIPAIQRSSNSIFHSIASRDESKLTECRGRFKPAKSYLGYAQLVEDPDVDAIYNPLPNSLHHEWTIKAAEQGKHVLCEKPVALNLDQCREMIDVCAAKRVTLMEAFMYRYTDRTRKVLEIVRAGTLGEIKFISSTFRFLLANPDSIKYKSELGGGCLYDVGCYPVNFTGMIVDELARARSGNRDLTPGSGGMPESTSVECVCANGVDVIFSALMRYPSGLIASINSGFNAQKRIFSEIIGTKGVLEIPDTFFGNAGVLTLTTDTGSQEISVAESDRYRLEIEDFADAIIQRREPHFSLTETVRNTELIDQLLSRVKGSG